MSALIETLVKAKTEKSRLEKATWQVGAIVRTPARVHGIEVANKYDVGGRQAQRAEGLL